MGIGNLVGAPLVKKYFTDLRSGSLRSRLTAAALAAQAQMYSSAMAPSFHLAR
jgi:hypothetical protein